MNPNEFSYGEINEQTGLINFNNAIDLEGTISN